MALCRLSVLAALLVLRLAGGHITNELSEEETIHTEESRATLLPQKNFDPLQDVNELRIALNGDVDEDRILNILTKRSSSQREEIYNLYPDLPSDLDSKLSGGFKFLMVYLAFPLSTYYASQISIALGASDSEHEDILVEVLATLNNSELLRVRNAYETTYGRSLINDLAQNPSNRLLKFLSSYVRGKRDEMNRLDRQLAIQDAQTLKRAGSLNLERSRKSSFGQILTSRSFVQLKQTFTEYDRVAGRKIEKVLQRDFSGNVQAGLLNIVKSIRDRPSYFAERLHAGIANQRSRDSTLVRIILTRSEKDMQDIKEAYERIYGTSIANFISDSTLGKYQEALLTLILAP